MKPEDVKIGMKVRIKYDPGSCVIKSLPDSKNRVDVEFFGYDGHSNLSIEDLLEFDPIKDQKTANKIQSKIDAAKTAFEKAFAALAKLQEEEQENPIFQSLKEEEMISTTELENTIEDNGWSSSSLWC